MMRAVTMRLFPAPLFFIVLAIVLASASCGGRGTGDDATRLSGRIEAVTVDLGPRVAGRVVEVRFREGERVKAGDVLVVVDLGEAAIAVARERAGARAAEERAEDLSAGSRASEIAVARAEVADRRAAVELAAKEAERISSLARQGIVSGEQRDAARTALLRAQAAAKASEERLALMNEGSRPRQTAAARAEAERATAVLRQSEVVAGEREVRAPADGIIVHRLAEPGQLVGAGQPAITMAFTDRLYVRTFIPETRLGRVKAGAAAKVVVDAFPGREFDARISEISPEAEFTPKAVETSAERVNLVYAAKADLAGGWSEPLVPGQPAEVIVPAAR
jgi:HlyD family secretion protein